VDDNVETRELIETCLAGSGYQITTVPTIAEGFRLASQQSYDLYLVDNLLPDGTGIELCRRLRTFDDQTPIIFFSALVRESERQKEVAAGLHAYLVKPEGFDDLTTLIERLLRGTESPRNRLAIAEEGD
jgi:DNA-binding response OmpR family regulator